MNPRTASAALAVLVTAGMAVYLLGSDEQADPVRLAEEDATARGSGAGDLPLVSGDADGPGAVDGARRIVGAEPDPNKIVFEEPWLPAAPDLDLVGMRGRDVLEAYWGDQWPEFAALQGERLVIADHYWAAPGDVLGQPEDMFADLVDRILEYLDGEAGPPRMIALKGGASPSPWDASGLLADLLNRAGQRSESGATLDPLVHMGFLSTVQDTLDQLLDPWLAVDEAVRELIVRQLSNLDRYTKPRLGTFTVSPLMNHGESWELKALIESGGTGRWFMSFVGSSRLDENGRRPSLFIGEWTVDISDDPRCAAAIALVLETEELVRSQLDSLEPEIVAALERP